MADEGWIGYKGFDASKTTPIDKVLQEVSRGAASVVDTAAVPRVPVTPTIGGTSTGFQRFGDGTNDVFYLRYTINAGDDATATSRLYLGYPEVGMLNPGESMTIISNTAITRLDIAALGDASDGTPTSGQQWQTLGTPDSEADMGTALVQFDFDSSDEVKTIKLTASDRFSAATAGAPAATANYVDVCVEGFSHA